MKGSFEDVVGYFIIFVVFIVGFLPVLSGFITQAQASTTEPNTIMILGLLVPFILVVMVVAYFMRLRGQKPFGEW
jgi:uncharacterized membrane protein